MATARSVTCCVRGRANLVHRGALAAAAVQAVQPYPYAFALATQAAYPYGSGANCTASRMLVTSAAVFAPAPPAGEATAAGHTDALQVRQTA